MDVWSSSYDHLRSLSRSVARSVGRSVARSLGRSVARSLGRSVARSLGRSIARSLDRSIARSLDRWSRPVRSVFFLYLVRAVGSGPGLILSGPVRVFLFLFFRSRFENSVRVFNFAYQLSGLGLGTSLLYENTEYVNL